MSRLRPPSGGDASLPVASVELVLLSSQLKLKSPKAQLELRRRLATGAAAGICDCDDSPCSITMGVDDGFISAATWGVPEE